MTRYKSSSKIKKSENSMKNSNKEGPNMMLYTDVYANKASLLP
jgi:hypothetical protein